MATFMSISKQLENLPTYITYTQNSHSTYTLFIPWCGQTLEWDVVFHDKFPKLGPDFIFDDAGFCPLLQSYKDTTLKTLLNNWEITQVSSLSILVEHLLKAYNQYMLNFLMQLEIPQAKFDVEMIKDSHEIQLKVDRIPNSTDWQSAQILVKIKEVDELVLALCRSLQEQSRVPYPSETVLIMVYSKGQESNPSIHVKFSESVLRMVGQPINMSAPQSGATMIDHINQINAEIRKALQSHQRSREIRDQFVQALGEIIGVPAEQYNPSLGNSNALFVVSNNAQLVGVVLQMDSSFPQQPPKLFFQVLNSSNQESNSMVQNWGEHLSARDMADRTFDAIKNHLTNYLVQQ
eukprot:TRINITY_DN3867_c0_g2_i1.p1 TRINITY_DN3867_c0_g2~~TRINITY_DN3867_c0_g2_i1.p1  ORF type:complete len:349 (-),score=18.41 TRINITY_DN3867_c0_g2_i1:1377-2423(-)